MEDYGILSIVPAGLSIVLAIYTRNIIFSLAIGIFCGSMILTGFNPFFAITDLMEKRIFVQVSNELNIQVIVVTLAIGGFIQLLDKSGGAHAFSSVITKFISTPVRAQLGAWFAGISVFFTDTGNALIIGPLFKPVFNELKICREKFAFILDSTAAPVSILIPFVGWGVYIMSLIENSYGDAGLPDDAFQVLLNIWPYQFYAFLALASIPMILSTGRDFGPMAKAQENYNLAIKNGTLDAEGDASVEPEAESSKPRMSVVVLPLSVMLVTMSGYIIYYAAVEGMKSTHVRAAIAISYLLASLCCAYLMKKHQNITYNQSMNQFVRGMEKLVLICLILALAWSLSSICKDLQTGAYLASIIGDTIDPNFLPLIVFVLGAIMSFATGTSYGTFAILITIVVPLAHALDAPMVLTLAGVLSGGLFGDHTSPISDTTVLASMGADCPHIDHVSTQLSYALISGSMAILAFTVAGFYQSPMIIFAVFVVQFIVLHGIMRMYGRITLK